MRNVIGLFLIIIIITAALPLTSRGETITIKGIGFDSLLSGNIQSSRGQTPGTVLNTKHALGIVNDQVIPEVEVKYRINTTNRVVVNFDTASYTGKLNNNMGIYFGGTTFPGHGELLKSTLDISMGSLYYEALFVSDSAPDRENESDSDYGFLFGVKYFYMDAKLASPTLGKIAEETPGMPIPVVGVRARSSLMDKTELEAAYVLSVIRTRNYDVRWSDFYAEVQYRVFPKIPIVGGYKIIKYDLNSGVNQTFLSHLGFKGWYLGAAIEF